MEFPLLCGKRPAWSRPYQDFSWNHGKKAGRARDSPPQPGTPGSEFHFEGRSPSRWTCRIPSTGLCVRSSSYSSGRVVALPLRRSGDVGPPGSLRLAIARNSREVFSDRVPQELLHHIQAAMRRFSRCRPASAAVFGEAQRKEQIVTAYLVSSGRRSSHGCVGHARARHGSSRRRM